jgi:hypothetical protein
MSKSKSTTPESPPKFLQSKEDVRPSRPEPSPQEFSVLPITDQRILDQYKLIEEAEEAAQSRRMVLLGMVSMIQPEGAQFNYNDRCFMVPIPEGAEDEEGDGNTEE